MINSEVLDIIMRSLYISGIATLIASGWAIPLGILIALREYRVKNVLKALFNSLIGLPTVLEGLILYLILARSGPLGWANLLYTVNAIIIGQAILITPLIVSFVITVLENIDPKIRESMLTLGASEWTADVMVVRHGLRGIIGSIMAGFNRALGELGIAFMLGGDIRFKTRVLTTAIAFETSLGNWDFALLLGGVFLIIISLINTAAFIMAKGIRVM